MADTRKVGKPRRKLARPHEGELLASKRDTGRRRKKNLRGGDNRSRGYNLVYNLARDTPPRAVAKVARVAAGGKRQFWRPDKRKPLPGRLELPTLRLTASRSNQLSYGSRWHIKCSPPWFWAAASAAGRRWCKTWSHAGLNRGPYGYWPYALTN